MLLCLRLSWFQQFIFLLKFAEFCPNFMHYTVFNNAGKEKPNIRRGADIFYWKDIILLFTFSKFLVFVSFCFYIYEMASCWITNPNRIIRNQRKICRPCKGHQRLIWNDENKKFPNHYLPVRSTISVSRKALKNPSYAKNPRTNKKALVKDRQRESIRLLLC